MKKAGIFLLIIINALTLTAQQTDFITSDITVIATRNGWDVSKLNTAKEVKYMTRQEKDVLLCINMVRTDPSKFCDEFIKPLLKCFSGKEMTVPGGEPVITSEGLAAVKELVKVLPGMKKADVLHPSEGLYKAAADLADYQSKTGKTGHVGDKGETLKKRISKYGTSSGTIAENVSYGEESPLMVVISLLIDDGVSSRGHRLNIMDHALKKAGAKWATHLRYSQMCAITFAAGYTEN